MAANGTAIVLNRVMTQMRTNTDEYASPESLATNFVTASEQLQNLFLGSIMQYQLGRPVPAQFSEATSDIRNLLDPFRKTMKFIYDTNTKTYKVDPQQITALETEQLEITKWLDWTRDSRSITFPPVQDLSIRHLDSQVNFPTDAFPVGKYIGEYEVQVWPDPGTNTLVESPVLVGDPEMKVSFIEAQLPKRVVSSDPTLTTPTRWRKRAYDSLVYLILAMYGIETSQPAFFQMATAMKNQAI